ncbi:sulfite exporter TauE/SafE family protein [soil metagenome]
MIFAELPPDFTTCVVLALSAMAAGALNSIAGGGTLLTFPALTAVLIDAAANATSTIALLPGSLAGAWGYRKEVWSARHFAMLLLVPSLLGGFLGAVLVVENPKAFSKLVPWLILTAAVLFLVQQPLSKWMKVHHVTETPSRKRIAVLVVAQFLIALYGGYFGAGIGILMLAALGFMGLDNIHRRNGVKTALATLINAASVVVFVGWGDADLVNWRYAGIMAVASIFGGYFGARIARKLPTAVVRGLVIAIGFSLAVYYFFLR